MSIPRSVPLLLGGVVILILTACSNTDPSEQATPSAQEGQQTQSPEPLYSPPASPVGPDYNQTYSVDDAALLEIMDVYIRALEVGNGSVDVVNASTLQTSMPNACQALSLGATAPQFAQLAAQNGIEEREALGVLAIALQSVCPELDEGVGATFPRGKTSSQFLFDPA